MESADRNRSETVVELVGRLLGGRGEEASLGRGDGQDLIPGVFFTLLATSWFYQHLARSTRRKSMPPPSRLVRLMAALPWDGVTGLVLSGLAILASVLGHGVAQREGRGSAALAARVTLYLAFSLPGLLSTLAFYWAKGRTALPRHTALLATCLAFLLELTLPPADSPFLLLTIAACALLSCCRLLLSPSPASPSSLLLALLTQSQGSWLLHCSLAPPPAVWAPTYFAWHLLAIYSTYTAAIVMLQARLSKDKEEKALVQSSTSVSPTTTLSSSSTVATSAGTGIKVLPPKPSLNTSTLQFVKEKEFKEFIKENPNIKEFIRDKQELLSPKIFEKQPTTVDALELERSASGLVRVLDCEPCDRVSSPGSDRVEPLAGQDRLERGLTQERQELGRARRDTMEGAGDRLERISPLEEFNTLHRHHPGVRASIKLKESDLV